jgi:hypothetical protein
METYRTWAHLFELLKYYSWIVDRFHISTMVYQESQGREYDFRWLEERLLPLGFCVVLCTRSEDSFGAAREERIKVSGKPAQYDDLKAFIDEQAAFRHLISKSSLPHLEIDVTGGDIGLTCDEIADFLEDNGLMSIRG